MGRPTTKNDLIQLANENYIKLNEYILKMTDKELDENWEAIRRFQTSGYKK